MGQVVNEVRSRLEQAWEERSVELDTMALQKRLATERIDITLPGIPCSTWSSSSTYPGR